LDPRRRGHGLISNQFDLRSDPHLFLHPVFALSALAWRLGLSLQVAFLAWQPVWASALVVQRSKHLGWASNLNAGLGGSQR
jgi:hypothetical protein